MLLTISTAANPATDLGFLLHKNPARSRRFEQSFGQAIRLLPGGHVERCTACLLVEATPCGWCGGDRAGWRRRAAWAVRQQQAVRCFVIPQRRSAEVFGTAIAGRSRPCRYHSK
jgi:hypothetical protein